MIAELLHAQYRAFLAANGIKKHRLPAPLHIPRPADLRPRPRARSDNDVRAVIAAAWGS